MEQEVKNEIKSVFDETVSQYKSQVEELSQKVKTLEEKKIAPAISFSGNSYKGYRLDKQLEGLKKSGFSEEKADFAAKAIIESIIAAKAGKMISLKSAAEHVEGTTTAGGFLVIDDYLNEIVTGARQLSVMAPLCRQLTTSSDTFKINANNAEFAVAIDAEGAVTKSSSTLKEISIPIKRISTYGAVSNELLADANWDVASWITEQITYKVGQTIDTQILNGTGTGAGQLNSGVLTAASTTSVVLSGTNLSSITADNMSLAMTKLAQLDSANGTFVFGLTGGHYIRTLKDTTNAPIFQAISSAMMNTVYGRPLVLCASISDATSSASTAYGVFGNFNQLYLVNRTSGLDLLVDPYSDSVSYNTRFIFSQRLGFGVGRGASFCRIVTKS
jgi:HK97 family phage major capsid protein